MNWREAIITSSYTLAAITLFGVFFNNMSVMEWYEAIAVIIAFIYSGINAWICIIEFVIIDTEEQQND